MFRAGDAKMEEGITEKDGWRQIFRIGKRRGEMRE